MAKLTLTNGHIHDCVARNLRAPGHAEGGALYAIDALASLAYRVLFRDNVGGEKSMTLSMKGTSFIDYSMPSEPGTWMPAATCVVNRNPCPETPIDVKLACKATRDQCMLTPGLTNVTVDGVLCQDATFNRERPALNPVFLRPHPLFALPPFRLSVSQRPAPCAQSLALGM